MLKSSGFLILIAILVPLAPARADEPVAAQGVAAIQDRHDRLLIKDLSAYVQAKSTAEDLDQAYMIIFDKAIEHDWYADHEPLALSYLKTRPEGPVKSLAQIVSTMARAQANDFEGALAQFSKLMAGLGKTEQQDFASNFTDTLANAAIGAGEYTVARQVYQAFLDRYGDEPNLREKIRTDLARLDRVGKPAPSFSVKDVKGAAFNLESFKGKYVLIDFWATWCAPCLAELPRLEEAYAKYHDRGLVVVGVSLDETKMAVNDFVKERKLPWTQIHNATCETDLVDAYGVGAIPATFLVDPDGKIARIELRGPALDQSLERLLGSNRTAAKPTSPPR